MIEGMRVVLPALALVACGGGAASPPAPAPGAEQRIAEDLARQVGVPVERVRCPDGPYPKSCTAEVPGSAGIELEVTEVGDELAWSVPGFVISTAPLAIQIGIELDDLGVEAEVDCGDTFVVTRVGEVIECGLAIGEARGAAWATITDDEGRFSLELALDQAAVEARRRPRDEAALLRRSLELDDGRDYDDEGEVSSPP